MKAMFSISYTRSPFWLVPCVSMRTTPHCGRDAEGRSSMTSLAKVTVSPAKIGFRHFKFLKPGDGRVAVPPQAAGRHEGGPRGLLSAKINGGGGDLPAEAFFSLGVDLFLP